MAKKRIRIDETVVAAHADDMALIVPLLGIEDLASFWASIRQRWDVADLVRAVDGFRADGSVEPFRALLVPAEPMKPRGYWVEWNNVERAIRDLEARLGRFPSSADLIRDGQSGLALAITKWHGSFNEVRVRMNQAPSRVFFHYADVSVVLQELRAFIDEIGRVPRTADFKTRGRGALLAGILNHGGLNEVLPKLGHKAARAHRVENPKDFSVLETELRSFVSELGHVPQQADFAAARKGQLLKRMSYHGGLTAVLLRLGFETEKLPKGYWAEEGRISERLLQETTRLGHFPTQRELCEAGLGGLVDQLGKEGGLEIARQRLGIASTQHPKKYWLSWDNAERELRQVMAEIGHFPTLAELVSLGRNDVARGVHKHHGGLMVARERMSVPWTNGKPRGYWQEWETVERELRVVIERLGRFPVRSDFTKEGERALHDTIRKSYGGLPAVRKRLGYDPVTDETIAKHADALVQIIPTIEVDPAILWSRMKRSWTTRDLDAAVSAHAATGSLDAFRRLLDAPEIPSRD